MSEKKETLKSQNENKIILVGNPNVGKSVIFNLLTGRYAIVSNYPGTTVEVSRGRTKISNTYFTVIDTPGISDFFGRTEDQRVTRDILLDNPQAIVIHIIDAKNLSRGLALNFLLCELGLKQVVVLNMMDEANDRGIYIDIKKLSEILGVPVVGMIATEHVGLHHLKESILKAVPGKYSIFYGEDVEKLIKEIEKSLPDTFFRKRGLALFLAGSTDQLYEISKKISGSDAKKIESIWEQLQSSISEPISYLITKSQIEHAQNIAISVSTRGKAEGGRIQNFFSRLTLYPVSGSLIAIFMLVILYVVVGKFGAGFLVDIFEKKLFGELINPACLQIFKHTPEIIRDFFVGEYGIITMAITYGIGIILPITTMFFLFFGVLEDCGYLPRLAFLTDRILKSVGLTGKSILPLVLGLGCGTMATLTTRILDTKKEKVIATVLLAVAIPCSAQLGVVLGILGSISALALAVWLATILIIMIIVGSALNLIIKGESMFSMEIPPLRIPDIRNIGMKTGRRVVWYLKEALPLFVLGTVILFTMDRTNLLSALVKLFSPVVNAMGLPVEMSKVFVMGFLRRDYGAAGMYSLFDRGILNPEQTVVSATVLTLFVPCIAQFFVMIKERGMITAIFIFIFAVIIAFFTGFLLSAILTISSLF